MYTNVVVSKGDSVKDGISQYQSFEGPAQEGENGNHIGPRDNTPVPDV